MGVAGPQGWSLQLLQPGWCLELPQQSVWLVLVWGLACQHGGWPAVVSRGWYVAVGAAFVCVCWLGATENHLLGVCVLPAGVWGRGRPESSLLNQCGNSILPLPFVLPLPLVCLGHACHALTTPKPPSKQGNCSYFGSSKCL